MPNDPRILVISFSNIESDARVLREISVVAKHGHVTSLGYGPKPDYVSEHIQVPDSAKSLPQTPLGVLRLALHLHNQAELAAPGNRYALRALSDRTFDAIVANDARALPLAFAIARRNQAPVWADLHEWAPGERTHIASWRILVKPLMEHICRKYLPQTAAATTVGTEIAKLYESHYGVRPRLLMNAAPYADLQPTHVPDGVIRLVHSGGAVFGRNIEAMIEATIQAGSRFTLDLYLVPAGDGGAYLEKLREVAGGNPRIRFHDPVKPFELPATLNAYDVGVFWIPPTHTNARLTLPNKLFDFVQARLAVAIGPTVEMVNVVNEYGLGVVSEDFSVPSIVAALQSLTPQAIASYKQAAATAAEPLSFESQSKVIDEILDAFLRTPPTAGSKGATNGD